MPFKQRARRSTIAGSLFLALAIAATPVLGAPHQAEAATSATLPSDSMTRTVKSGWGSATAGGAYTVVPTGAGSVSGSSATLASPGSGRIARALLPGTAVKDATSQIDMTFSKLPGAGSTAYAAHLVRATADAGYAARLVTRSDGSAALEIQRSKGMAFTYLAGIKSPVKITAGKPVVIKVAVSGESTVTVQAKVWTKGEAEPAGWQLTTKDTSDARVRTGGSVGVLLYASGAGAVLPVGFDNLAVTSLSSTPPPITATPKPTPTPTVTPTVAPPTTPNQPDAAPVNPGAATVDYAGKRGDVGASAPGSVDYAVPAGAVYVATNGSDANAGTLSAPLKSITKAVEVAKNWGTVVVRGGSYHEEVWVLPRTGVTIQPYRNEAVWLDGAETVTGWTASGNTWVKSGWNAIFDHSPTYAKGAADGTAPGWQWIDPAKPLAAYPDQVWIDGAALTQVGSRAAVTTGTFYVDEGARQLVVGSNPAGKTVEASTLAKGITVRATDATIKGIGVRRYATSVPMMGTVSLDQPRNTLENVTIRDNATTGFYTWSSDITLRDVSVINNGLMGAGAATSDRLNISGMLSANNNSQGFNRAPVSGALKIGRSRDVSVTASSFINNAGQGPWFDESVYDITFTDNDVVANAGNGLVIELSDTAVVANNLISGSGLSGVALINSGNVSVWNNTLNANGVRVEQDARRASNTSTPGHDPRRPNPDPTVPWIAKNIVISNNVVSVAAGDCVLCVNDWSREFTGAKMIAESEGNLYQRANATSPKVFAKWSQAASGTATFVSFAEYQKATGRDTSSKSVDGAAVLTANMGLQDAYASSAVGYTRAVPAPVADVSALNAGSKTLGVQSR